ncbi:synaptobrevin, WD40/YVTN repeat-like-containing domain protein [Tanacetum coccineum]
MFASFLDPILLPEGNGGYVIEKIYIAGYVDGSVRIWDATSPVLSILCIIGTMKDVAVTGSTALVSELCFCSSTSGLAVGNQLGLVRVYNFSSSSKETSLHIVAGTKKESQKQPQKSRLAALDEIGAYLEALDFLLDICRLNLGHVLEQARLTARCCGR